MSNRLWNCIGAVALLSACGVCVQPKAISAIDGRSPRLPRFTLSILPIRFTNSVIDAQPARSGGFAGDYYTEFEKQGPCERAFVYQRGRLIVLPRAPYHPDPDNPRTNDSANDIDRRGRIAGTSELVESGGYTMKYSAAWVYKQGAYHFLPGGGPDSAANAFDAAGNIHGQRFDSESMPKIDCAAEQDSEAGTYCVWTSIYREPRIDSDVIGVRYRDRFYEPLKRVKLPPKWQLACDNPRLQWEILQTPKIAGSPFWLATPAGKCRIDSLITHASLAKIIIFTAISNDRNILGQGTTRGGRQVAFVLTPAPSSR